MLECIRCKSTWPDELDTTWGETEQTNGYGPEPRCIAVVPNRKGDANEVCGGRLRAAADPQDTRQLMLLSPIGDKAAKSRADEHNQARLRANKKEPVR